MADSIPALITQNIVSELNGKTIYYDAVPKTITVDRERITNCYADRYPLIIVRNPVLDNFNNSTRTTDVDLYYTLTYVDNSINDEYVSGGSVISGSEVVENVIADIHKLMMNSPGRGGYAFFTFPENAFSYFENINGVPLMVIDFIYKVKAQMRFNDFYTIGG
jgi:hypothetical protein